MKVFGITGYSGMGKTTLLERLLPELAARGLRVSLIKHSHKEIEVDKPGKDSWRLRQAGCQELLLMGHRRWALMHELQSDDEPELEDLLGRLQDCDLVLIEGFKQGDFPKLEVWRASEEKPPLWPGPGIVAVACPRDDLRRLAPRARHCALLPLEEVGAIADFVIAHASPARRGTHPLRIGSDETAAAPLDAGLAGSSGGQPRHHLN